LRNEIFLFSLQFSATLINLAQNGQFFYENQAHKGKLAQNGQILYDNCWAIRLIAALLLTFMSHITASPVATGGIWWAKPPNWNIKTINGWGFVNLYNVKASTGKQKLTLTIT